MFSSPSIGPSQITSVPDAFNEQRGRSDAIMVDGHVAVICVAVAALAVTAAALGIAGEATKSKQSFVRYDGANCVYRRTPAFGFGVAAAASLLTGQVVLTAAAGCWDRCRMRSDDRRAGVVFSSLLSWFLAVLAATAFLVGAVRNQSGERRPKGDISAYYRCTVLVAGVFAGGSFFAIAAAAVGIGSYVTLESEAAGSGPPRPPSVHQYGVEESSGRASWAWLPRSQSDDSRLGWPDDACAARGSTKARAGTVL
ncbi:hypothetical protein BAE44_0003412 [Dichanthelium oligosanthes]|uniref:Uncharacterized protein n=1 Tax=Dichanthelium oligosanthes TaxID=888268 RepID=A0A1E5WE53_9POAL|nr:hypothetical protein BAE44_0003412 [Dichanthelium oligosanthes]